VLFFAPLVRMLELEDVEVVVTARDFSQTIELAAAHGLKCLTVGEHRTPRNYLGRATATLARAWELASKIRPERPQAAISHGSRAQVMAARLIGIPVLAIYDYEFIAAGVFNRLAQRVLVPDCVSLDCLREQGLDIRKYRQYPGFKEEVYVYDFVPHDRVLSDLELDPERLIVSIRPQANWAHYHNQHSEELFIALIERLRCEQNAQVLLLPRTPQQREDLLTRYGITGSPFRVLETAVDGLNLMFHSDAVFSGGGTMAREAALLGVNVYSFFAGKMGAADKSLAEAGKLRILKTAEEVSELVVTKQAPRAIRNGNATNKTKNSIFDQMVEFAAEHCNVNPAIRHVSAVS